MPTVVTLLSDFGSATPYPAAMKVVLAEYCDAALIDISHDVARHDVRMGAYLLRTMVPFTPAGTVHLAVVDPGVGTARRALIVVSGGQSFVGPDNGLLLPAAKRLGQPRVFAITNPTRRTGISTTFHGRDLFAPVAGRLVRGVPPEAMGVPAEDYVDLDLGAGRREGAFLRGTIIYVDHFGNLITNISSALLPGAGRAVRIAIGRKTASGAVAGTYGAAVPGALVVVPGSDGFAEVAEREGSAADRLHGTAGMSVRITLKLRD